MLKLSSVSLAVMSLLAVASANAADINGRGSLKDDVRVDGVRVQNWSGLYVGAGCGVGTSTVSLEDDKGGISANGQECEARLGFDGQLRGLVVGGFANYALGNQALELGGMTILEKDEQWDANARLGVVLGGNTLFYGFGGYGQQTWSAIGGGEADIAFWQAGLGIEHAIATNFTIRLEYTHQWLDADDAFGSGASNVLDTESDAIKFGVNYKFNSDTLNGVFR
jgi:opacity protein-like surface antigen